MKTVRPRKDIWATVLGCSAGALWGPSFTTLTRSRLTPGFTRVNDNSDSSSLCSLFDHHQHHGAMLSPSRFCFMSELWLPLRFVPCLHLNSNLRQQSMKLSLSCRRCILAFCGQTSVEDAIFCGPCGRCGLLGWRSVHFQLASVVLVLLAGYRGQ